MILREKHSRSLDSERDRNNVFTEITAWLTTIVLYLGSFYKKERQAARPFIFPTEGLAITFYLSPLPQIDYTRARRREGMTIRERERVRGGGAADLPGIVVDPNLPSCFYGTRVTWSFICTHEK